jgi:hypothetical protein
MRCALHGCSLSARLRRSSGGGRRAYVGLGVLALDSLAVPASRNHVLSAWQS